MSSLVVFAYDDKYKAEEVRLMLRKMQQDQLIDLDDAVVAVKDDAGKVKEQLAGTGGTVFKTSLTHEDEAKLQAALSSTANF